MQIPDSVTAQTDQLRPFVAAQMESARADLAALVALPSVHGYEPEACRQAAAMVAAQLAELGVPGMGAAQVQQVEAEDGSLAVFAHRPAAPGKPTVLLYSHYDVQPAGDLDAWDGSPWHLREHAGRWYGRGTADCKGNYVMHLVALRAVLAAHAASGSDTDPFDGLGLRIVVEGSEETGAGGLEKLVASRPELFDAEAICIADSGNAAVGVPTLSTSLRGVAHVTVETRALRTGVHSGQFGGPAPDPLFALIHMLSSLRDVATGATTIDGLDATGTWNGLPYEESAFRADAGILDGVDLSTAANVADMVWAQPTANVLGIDCPSVSGAVGAIQPAARALVQLRIPPGMDPLAAQRALVEHLEARRPWNVEVHVDAAEDVAYPFSTVVEDGPGRLHQALGAALAAAYGAQEVAEIGSGGSIPLCTALQQAFPSAELALYGVEDPAAAIHSPGESVDPREIEHIALAEAAFLTTFART